MDSTYERWKAGRPVHESLPEVYHENPIADWLTDYPDQVLQGLKVMATEVAPLQVNPDTCEPEWLDLLSSLCGWYGYWDVSWPEASKRRLIKESYTTVWPNYGTAETLSFVLTALGVTHLIQQGESFIIGRNVVGDPLGAIAWTYDIILPTALFDTKEYNLTVRINELFGPCFCKSRILFNDEYFKPTGFFELEENTLLSVGDSQTVLEL